MKKFKLFLINMLIVSSFSIFAQAKKDEPRKDEPKKEAQKSASIPEEIKWYDLVTFSGFADVYYNYLNNNKMGNQQDTSGTFNTYNKQFAINAVELDIEKLADKQSPWGFRIDFQNGQNLMYQERPYSTTNSIYNMQLLQQAYVSFYLPVGNGVTVDVGKMSTHIGNEVLESKDNWNYTIGYIFFNTIPFIHTGVRAATNFTEKWAGSLYVYNSAQGTGFYNPYSGYSPAYDHMGSSNPGAVNGTALNSAGTHSYNDSMNSSKSVGTQLKGNVANDKIQIVWNTLLGNDNPAGRTRDSQILMSNLDSTNTTPIGRPGSQMRYDHWFINHMMITFYPTEKAAIRLDYTHGEKTGAAAANQGAYVNDGVAAGTFAANFAQTVDSAYSNLTVLRDKKNVNRTYNTYGIFAKYDFSSTWALGLRYEHIDDSKFGGAFVVNAPLYAVTPQDRLDLLFLDKIGVRKASNLGQIRTFTLTPTFTWSENIIIKLDIRRDWGLGEQFVNAKGRPAHHQDGLILGIVAKF